MGKRIFVGLSGGVDSAVSAALLKREGYEVTGAFIKIWSPDFLECTWREDRLDAMRVCVTLGIPFREIDLSRQYLEAVIGDMTATYRRGETPNPDVLCNRSIKFGAFAQWAFAQGADMLATGHYARIGKRDGSYALLRGKDANKDQSYFLHRLRQEDLARALFPIGEYDKREVRALAQRFGLPVARKPDSQGLCFVGDITLPEFLARFIPLEKGPVVDEGGAAIGEHDGAALYTIGQRHGIRAPGGPHFVTRIDVASNTVFVSAHAEKALSREAALRDMHWIEGEPSLPLAAQAMPRYRAPLSPVEISREGGAARVRFAQPQLACPGQSLVLYDGDRCLGGGVISA